MTIKIQCPCGVKYALEVTPEHLATPIRFVCQQCGVDSSAAVNQIVRQQFGAPPAQPRVQVVANPSKPAAPKPVAVPKVQAPPPPNEPAPAATAVPEPGVTVCHKHSDQPSTSNCLICQKPICPECMRLFGYVCSAFCAGQAERAGVALPVYENQKSVVEARFWRKVKWAGTFLGLVALGLLCTAVWYNFVGSRPRPTFSVKLPEKRSDGFCKMVARDQAIVRHGSRLIRYDVKSEREVWSASLIDAAAVEESAAKYVDDWQFRTEEVKLRRARLKTEGRFLDEDDEDEDFAPRSESQMMAQARRMMEERMMEELRFHFAHPDLWVIYSDKVVHFDWETGKMDKEIALRGRLEEFFPNAGSLLVLCSDRGEKILTQIRLPGGEAQTEALKPEITTSTNLAGARNTPGTKFVPVEIPLRAMTVHFQPEIFETELGIKFESAAGRYLANSGPNAVDMKVDLLEEKITQIKTMKERPKKSALEGDVNMQATGKIANEILNEMQEQRTGGIRLEDESRYLVTIRRRLANVKDWVGELNGPPHFFSSKTVDVLTAGKTMIVLDKNNQKLWETQLAYKMSPQMMIGRETWNSEDAEEFLPCVERGQTLFVFDQGVLAAFDLLSGNARWRLPSVGVTSLKFDDKGLMYVMTTSAQQEDIKYVDQIDVTRQTVPVLMKVDPQTGKVLWKLNRTGETCLISGKYFYAVEGSSGADDPIRPTRAHTRIYRLEPRSGRVIWEHLEAGYPMDMDFHENTILALFPDELRVLKFL